MAELPHFPLASRPRGASVMVEGSGFRVDGVTDPPHPEHSEGRGVLVDAELVSEVPAPLLLALNQGMAGEKSVHPRNDSEKLSTKGVESGTDSAPSSSFCKESGQGSPPSPAEHSTPSRAPPRPCSPLAQAVCASAACSRSAPARSRSATPHTTKRSMVVTTPHIITSGASITHANSWAQSQT